MRTSHDEDAYVTCEECGHPVERHDARVGCGSSTVDFCPCSVKWTRREIAVIRRENGLPARWAVGTI